MRRALVVTRDLESGSTWTRWLRAAGYSTGGCVGPDLTFACPLRRGLRCPQRDTADVVVLALASDAAGVCVRGDDEATVAIGPRDAWASDRRAFVSRVAVAAGARTIVLPDLPWPGARQIPPDHGRGRAAGAAPPTRHPRPRSRGRS